MGQITSLSQAKSELRHLAEEDLYLKREALAHADLLISLMDKFPDLEKDEESSTFLCKITEGLYSIKEFLPQDKRDRIVQIFRNVHHLQPTYIHKLLESHEPAGGLVEKYKDVEAIIRGKQEYPVPISLLVGEEMPCNAYFKSLVVELGDGSTVKVSQGLLAHFSEMVKVMLLATDMKAPDKIVLEQLNRHEFDTMIAFLETSQKNLINQDNAKALLYAAAYLQIPELLEECALYLYLFLDDETAAALFNLTPKNLRKNILVFELEKYLSELIKKGLLTMKDAKDSKESREFHKRMQSYKDALNHPVRLDLSGTDISDDDLKELVSFPIEELDIRNCPKLTKNAMPIIGTFKSLRKLLLDGNDWVNDEALKGVPENIESLSLGTCKKFTEEGLRNLENSSVRELFLFGCQHLTDKDLASLPQALQVLDLSYCHGVKEGTMKHLAGMENLSELVLSGIPLTKESIGLMPKKLEKLDASDCPVDDEGMKAISEMNRLRELNLSSTKITDNGLKQLPASIGTLILNGCTQLTDDGVSKLKTLSFLKSLFLRRCPNITRSVVEDLRRKCDVAWDEPQPSRLARRLMT